LQPLSGKLYTHFRTKYIFLAFLFLFELGSLICALAPSSVVFIIGRAVAGLGVSGGLNGALTIIAAGVPREKSPMYVGILIGVAQMGVVSGPLIGGAFTEHVSWRWCFYINLPVGGLAAAILSFLTFPEVTKKEPFTLKHLRKVLPQLDLVGCKYWWENERDVH
jgi:MFS family permease